MSVYAGGRGVVYYCRDYTLSFRWTGNVHWPITKYTLIPVFAILVTAKKYREQ